MRRTFLRAMALAGLAAVAVGSALDQAEASCPGADIAVVNVTVDTPSVTHDQSLSRAEIFHKATGAEATTDEGRSIPAITTTQIHPHGGIDYTADSDGEGQWCTHL